MNKMMIEKKNDAKSKYISYTSKIKHKIQSYVIKIKYITI